MKWVPGRQGGGYQKLSLLRLKSADAYLLRYPAGSFVRFHTDEVPGFKHYRLNVVLRKARLGGDFQLLGRPLLAFWRFRLFRPDRYAHAVEPVVKGERLVLSVGWIRPED